MKISNLSVDSRILKRKLFEITGFEEDWFSFSKHEPAWIGKYDPDYLQIRIDSKDLDIINYFEDHGFRFAEFKVYRRLATTYDQISSAMLYPYIAELVSDKHQLAKILKIAENSIFEDRFSMDHHFPHELSKQRNLSFIKRSFNNKGEFLLEYLNEQTGQLAGFQSGRFLNSEDVILHLNGIAPGLEVAKYRELFDHLLFNWLKFNKVKFIYAVSSGLNMKEMNLAFNRQGYSIESTSVVLRKIYRDD